jgi:hypothetical protein
MGEWVDVCMGWICNSLSTENESSIYKKHTEVRLQCGYEKKALFLSEIPKLVCNWQKSMYS